MNDRHFSVDRMQLRVLHMTPDWRTRPPTQWPVLLRHEWEERAAILEHDAGMDRSAAEQEAALQIRERDKK